MADPRIRHHDLLMEGHELSAKDATMLEANIESDPNDFESHVKLLGYYFGKSFRSHEAKTKHEQLALWLIENHPESRVAGLPEARIDMTSNPVGFAKADRLWQDNTRKHEHDAIVLGNAAHFYELYDHVKAEGLFKKAQLLDPENAEWSRYLGHLYEREAHTAAAADCQDVWERALVQFERAVKVRKDQIGLFSLLPDLATCAFEAGQTDKAKEYALQLLKMGNQKKHRQHNGNAVHHGNLVLGRLALQAGDVEKAKSFLLEAGKTQGSPQLDSFGPNMTLAKELLERGEREVVLEYFQLCAKFWKGGELDNWSAVVKGGGMPDFGANLWY